MKIKFLVAAAMAAAILTAACGTGNAPNAAGGASAIRFTAASSNVPIPYDGGPVNPFPQVYLIFWGSWWVDHGAKYQTALKNLFKGLGGTSWSRTLDQYCTTGSKYWDNGCPDVKEDSHLLVGSIVDPTDPPERPTDNRLAAEAATAFKVSARARSLGDTVIPVVVTGPGVAGVQEMDGACGHHYWGFYNDALSFPGAPPDMQPFGWAYVSEWASDPANNSGAKGCFDGNHVNVSGGLTITAAHEFAEAVTDMMPTRNGKIDWVTEPSSESGTGTQTWAVEQAYSLGPNGKREIGDSPCRTTADIFQIKLATGTFWIQRLWSNKKDACVKGS
jgi:hypothetical protein